MAKRADLRRLIYVRNAAQLTIFRQRAGLRDRIGDFSKVFFIKKKQQLLRKTFEIEFYEFILFVSFPVKGTY